MLGDRQPCLKVRPSAQRGQGGIKARVAHYQPLGRWANRARVLVGEFRSTGRTAHWVRPADDAFIDYHIGKAHQIQLVQFGLEQGTKNSIQDETRKPFLHFNEQSIQASVLFQGVNLHTGCSQRWFTRPLATRSIRAGKQKNTPGCRVVFRDDRVFNAELNPIIHEQTASFCCLSPHRAADPQQHNGLFHPYFTHQAGCQTDR